MRASTIYIETTEELIEEYNKCSPRERAYQVSPLIKHLIKTAAQLSVELTAADKEIEILKTKLAEYEKEHVHNMKTYEN